MDEQFVSESINPVPGTADTSRMAVGEPGLSRSFSWRNRRYDIAEILEKWKESSPCRNGSAEVYLRKHWYSVRTTTGQIMKIYFERQARSQRQAKSRWWLYTIISN